MWLTKSNFLNKQVLFMNRFSLFKTKNEHVNLVQFNGNFNFSVDFFEEEKNSKRIPGAS